MRRLPIYFVLDCSESMVGERLQEMEQGISAIVHSLRTDPHALETVFISVVAFAGIAKTITPMVDVISYYPAKLPLGGGTSLGAALEELMGNIDKHVIKTTHDQKGDWKPIVYLFTDGRPTDNFAQAIKRWHADYAKKVTLIAVGMGKQVDYSVLHQLTENVLLYEQTKDNDFKEFIRWVTASIAAQSKSVGEGQQSTDVLGLRGSALTLVKDELATGNDETCVTFVGRCRKNRRPYIMRYDKENKELVTQEFKFDISRYQLTGCYPLEESYFSWTDKAASTHQVNTDDLIGSPGCPHCGAGTAFAVCGCGKFLCLDEADTVTCPWCEQTIEFSYGDGSGFDVSRGRG